MVRRYFCLFCITVLGISFVVISGYFLLFEKVYLGVRNLESYLFNEKGENIVWSAP